MKKSQNISTIMVGALENHDNAKENQCNHEMFACS